MRYEIKLPEITYPFSLDTIGKELAMGYETTMYCSTCGRHARVNLVTIAKRRGMDYPNGPDDLRKVVKCSKCGGSDRLTFVLSPPNLPDAISKWPRQNTLATTS